MFEPETGLIIWTIISFSILVLLLYKVLLPPLLLIIEKREKQISLSIEKAEKVKQDADHLLKQYQEKISKAEETTGLIIKKAKDSSLALIKEAEEKSKERSKQILNQAELEIIALKNQMVHEVKQAGADLVLSAASRVLGREIQEADNARLIKESLDAIEEI